MDQNDSKPARLSYSLRTLLFVPVVLAVPLGWLGWKWNLSARQHRLIAALQNGGAVVALSNRGEGPTVIGKYLSTPPIELVSGIDSDDAASNLTGLHDVQSVSFGGQTTDVGISYVQPLHTLQSISVTSPAVTNAALGYVSRLPKLARLYLYNTQITDAGLQQLSQLNHLLELALVRCEITDSGLRHLGKLTGLRVLHLEGTKISNHGLTALSDLQLLERIDVQNTGVTLDGFLHFCMDLQQRDLNATLKLWQGEGSAEKFRGPPHVWLRGGGVHDALLPYLERESAKIKSLVLSTRHISSDGMAPLAKLTNLESLAFEELAGHTLSWPLFEGCKKLKSISLSGHQLTDDVVAGLHTLRSLEAISLDFKTVVELGVFGEIAELPNIQQLNFTGTPIDCEFDKLANQRNLERLSLGDTLVTGRGLAKLAGLKRLSYLRLSGTPIDKDGLAEVGSLRQLTTLCLNATSISDQGLKPIAQLRALTTLELNDTSISDASVTTLRQLKKLEVLHLDGTNFTENGLVQLEEALPHCQIGNERFKRRVMMR